MNNPGPRHVRSASADGPPAGQVPWTNLDPPVPYPEARGTTRAPAHRRITQAKLDRMAELRRQGATHLDIAAQLGCSDRTVRRYAGKVQRQLVKPPARAPTDLEGQRAELLRWYTAALHGAWDRFPSVALVDESIRELAKQLQQMRPETIALVASDSQMRSHLLIEVVAPLLRDFETFQQVQTFFERLGDPRPMAWSRDGKWQRGEEDEDDAR